MYFLFLIRFLCDMDNKINYRMDNVECLLESIPLWLILFAFGWFLYLISPFSKVTNKQKDTKHKE